MIGVRHGMCANALEQCFIIPLLLLPIGCASSHASSPPKSADPFMTGTFLGSDDLDARYRSYVELTGTRPDLLMTFVAWPKQGASRFPTTFCHFCRQNQAIPIITWEPWETWKPDRGWYPMLSEIATGRYDPHIRSFARSARRWGHPLWLRFAHEMNGDWYPWSQRKDPRQTAQDYVSAWQRIHRIFREDGAKNVQFVWSVNFEPTENLSQYYPGDAYVDFVGVDMYNQPDWPRSPDDMIQFVYEFASARRKPIILTEVGSAEHFVDIAQRGAIDRSSRKTEWIKCLFRLIQDRRNIRGLVWFDIQKEADWRIGSSQSSAAAYRRGLRALDTNSTQNR